MNNLRQPDCQRGEKRISNNLELMMTEQLLYYFCSTRCLARDCLSRSRTAWGRSWMCSQSSPWSSSRRQASRNVNNCCLNRAQYLHIIRWIFIIIRWCRGSDRSMDSDTRCDTSLQLNIQCDIYSSLLLGIKPFFFETASQQHACPVKHNPAVGRSDI